MRGSGQSGIASSIFGRARATEAGECSHCQAARDPKDLFCPQCGEDFTGTDEAMVLEPYPPGSPADDAGVLEEYPPGS